MMRFENFAHDDGNELDPVFEPVADYTSESKGDENEHGITLDVDGHIPNHQENNSGQDTIVNSTEHTPDKQFEIEISSLRDRDGAIVFQHGDKKVVIDYNILCNLLNGKVYGDFYPEDRDYGNEETQSLKRLLINGLNLADNSAAEQLLDKMLDNLILQAQELSVTQEDIKKIGYNIDSPDRHRYLREAIQGMDGKAELYKTASEKVSNIHFPPEPKLTEQDYMHYDHPSEDSPKIKAYQAEVDSLIAQALNAEELAILKLGKQMHNIRFSCKRTIANGFYKLLAAVKDKGLDRLISLEQLSAPEE